MNTVTPVSFESVRGEFREPDNSPPPLPTISTKPLAALVRREVAQVVGRLEKRDEITQEIARIDSDLQGGEPQLRDLEARRATLEGASPVALHRLKVDQAAAARESDELQGRIQEIYGDREEKSRKRESLSIELHAHGAALRKDLETVANHRRLLAEADFYALICSTIPGRDLDVVYHLIHDHSNLWQSTTAHRICEDQLRRIRTNEDLPAVIKEMLDEPIIEISRYPIALHDNDSTPLAREVRAFSK